MEPEEITLGLAKKHEPNSIDKYKKNKMDGLIQQLVESKTN